MILKKGEKPKGKLLLELNRARDGGVRVFQFGKTRSVELKNPNSSVSGAADAKITTMVRLLP